MAYDDSTAPSDPSGGPAERRTAGKAVASLVLGVLSTIVAGILLGSIAIWFGVRARNEIRSDPNLTGDGMALAGIITGVIGVLLMVGFLIAGGGTGY